MFKKLLKSVFSSDKPHPLNDQSQKQERFTNRARHVLSLAQAEAEHQRHNFIRPEHVLVALIEEAGGTAYRVLSGFGKSPQEMVSEIRRLSPAREESITGIEVSNEVKQVLEYAVDEARRFGHKHIGSEHLLLGLFRQNNNVVMTVFSGLNLTRQETQQKISELYKEFDEQTPPATTDTQG